MPKTNNISATYFLVSDRSKTVVVHVETGLRLNVFYLDSHVLSPAIGELCIYGDDHGSPLAFQTQDYDMDNLAVYEGAVLWFAKYLNYPEMTIRESDPRRTFKLSRLDEDDV